MIHVLLVEDEAPKRDKIVSYLNGLDLQLSIRTANSVNSALDELDKRLPDILLLDMSLPTFDISERESGGRPQGFGGIEVLRFMSFSELLCPTIVITGYDAFLREAGKTVDLVELRSELEAEFPKILRDVLQYDSSYDTWKTSLKKLFIDFEVSRRNDNEDTYRR